MNGAIRPFNPLRSRQSIQFLSGSALTKDSDVVPEEEPSSVDQPSVVTRRSTDERLPLNGHLGHGLKQSRANVGYRLGRRKVLYERRKRVSDYALVFGMLGTAIMILETELCMNQVYNKV